MSSVITKCLNNKYLSDFLQTTFGSNEFVAYEDIHRTAVRIYDRNKCVCIVTFAHFNLLTHINI